MKTVKQLKSIALFIPETLQRPAGIFGTFVRSLNQESIRSQTCLEVYARVDDDMSRRI